MNILGAILPSIFGFLGNQGAQQQQAQANQLAQQQLDLMKPIIQYQLHKQQQFLDPILESEVYPSLLHRMQHGPAYAPMAQNMVGNLSRGLTLNY